MNIALITGVTGQDGSYLSEHLLELGYQVHGIVRRSSIITTNRIDHLLSNPKFKLHFGDLVDSSSLIRILSTVNPTEVYHLAAQSHVGVSFEVPQYTGDVTGLGTTRLLDAILLTCPQAKFYNASTSEIFGGFQSSVPQNELTPFHPRSPYGTAKLYSHWVTRNYREAFNLFASNGILFNHESPRRGITFVTRKITRGVAQIYLGSKEFITLGNLDAIRDWGYALDYVRAIHQITQHRNPDDFVVATGRGASVREFCEIAFKIVGIEIRWTGIGEAEIGIDAKTGQKLVAVDPRYIRPSEVNVLIGDPSKAHALLGWKSETGLEELVELMIRKDIDEFKK